MTKDQKSALTVAGGGGALLFYVWRKRQSGGYVAGTGRAKSNKTPAVTTSYGGQIAPFNPQSPVTLQPGESVYDPNTLGLLDTPTAISAGQSLASARPGYVVNVNYPKPVKKKNNSKKPAVRKPNKASQSGKTTGSKSQSSQSQPPQQHPHTHPKHKAHHK